MVAFGDVVVGVAVVPGFINASDKRKYFSFAGGTRISNDDLVIAFSFSARTP